MNERIGQLAEAAKLLGPGSRIGNAHEATEKFAELVVRECIGIAQDRAAFDWAPPNDVNHIINEIKEHFGVEQ
jgi:hypothetical protein